VALSFTSSTTIDVLGSGGQYTIGFVGVIRLGVPIDQKYGLLGSIVKLYGECLCLPKNLKYHISKATNIKLLQLNSTC